MTLTFPTLADISQDISAIIDNDTSCPVSYDHMVSIMTFNAEHICLADMADPEYIPCFDISSKKLEAYDYDTVAECRQWLSGVDRSTQLMVRTLFIAVWARCAQEALSLLES